MLQIKSNKPACSVITLILAKQERSKSVGYFEG